MGVNRTVTLEGKGCFGSKCFEQPVFFKLKNVITSDQETGQTETEWDISSAV
jgi:hypothetical protein